MKNIGGAGMFALAGVAAIVALLAWWKGNSSEPSVHGADQLVSPAVAREKPANQVQTRQRRSTVNNARIDLAEIEARHDAHRHDAKQIVEAGRSKLIGQYQSERVDAGWALVKERTLKGLQSNTHIHALNAQPSSLVVACRTSVCRLDAEFDSRIAAADWFTLYTLNAGTEMSNVSVTRTNNQDGTVHLEIYGSARQSTAGN